MAHFMIQEQLHSEICEMIIEVFPSTPPPMSPSFDLNRSHVANMIVESCSEFHTCNYGPNPLSLCDLIHGDIPITVDFVSSTAPLKSPDAISHGCLQGMGCKNEGRDEEEFQQEGCDSTVFQLILNALPQFSLGFVAG